MKKLLYITTYIQGSGGISRILSVKLNYLITTFNYQVTILETNKKGNAFFYDFNESIIFKYIDSKNIFKYKKELNKQIEAINPDIIVNCDNGLKGTLLTYLIPKNTSLIYERHCSKNIDVASLFEKIKLKLSNLLLQHHIEKYAAFVVLNTYEKNNWKASNIIVLPNPSWVVDIKNNSLNSTKIVIAVGRHDHVKAYHKLIKIWESVVITHPLWILKIYGQKNENLLLEKMAISLNLENNIQFLDPINDVDKIYSGAEILLSTSLSESFPMVFLEAMAYGIPVMSFEGTSGLSDLVKHGKNGFLIKNNNMSDYIEKLNFLIGDEIIRQKMGKIARKSINKFNLHTIMKQWQDLFKTI